MDPIIVFCMLYVRIVFCILYYELNSLFSAIFPDWATVQNLALHLSTNY